MQMGWSWHIEWQSFSEFHGHLIERVIEDIKSPYQRVMVAELAKFGKALIIDGKIQSTVYDEFIYHETLVHPLLLSIRTPENVLILGGGEGATLREVLKHKTVKRAVMVDIDQEVINFAKKYLQEWHKGSFDDPRVSTIISDAYQYVINSKEKFDAVIMDLTDPILGNSSYKLYTREYYEKVKEIIKPGGGMVTQATSPSFNTETFTVIYNTLKQVFQFTVASIVYVPAFDGLWGFVYASDYVNPLDLLKEDLDKKIRERINGELRFYDAETHRMIFSIPKYIRDEMLRQKKVSTEKEPTYIPT